ncbi:MAG: tetratricopeptide repeat protein [Gemmatimonadota bacterium]
MRTPLAVRLALLAAAWALAAPLGLEAQQAQPLRKGEMVRLLTAGTYTQTEIAGIVRRSCLTFRPTDRDLENFRTLGADESVLEEVRGCALRRASPRAEGPARVRPPAGDAVGGGAPPRVDLTLFLSPRRATVAAGESLRVVAEVTGGAAPAPGVRLELREEAGPGTGGAIAEATTDAEGLASFSIPAAEQPGVRRFSVTSPDVSLQGVDLVEVETVAGGAPEPPSEEEPALAPSREEGGVAGVPEPAPASRWRTVEEGLREAERLSLEGRYREAGAIYEALLQERPDDVDVLVAYGVHLARTGGSEEAKEVLQKAFGLQPRRADVRRALGRLSLWGGRPEEAVRWFRSITELLPNDPEAWRELGEAYVQAGLRNEARAAYRRARELEAGR